MSEHVDEVWADIPQFDYYKISNLGRIYNDRFGRIMRPSLNNHNNLKISLLSSWDGNRYTRSVAQLVAEQFVEPTAPRCDFLMLLDGDPTNCAAYNIVYRPRWFAWKYVRQLKTPQPRFFHNLPVRDLTTGEEYESVIAAGMAKGLLFQDIWDSTYNGKKVYPDASVWEVIKRV